MRYFRRKLLYGSMCALLMAGCLFIPARAAESSGGEASVETPGEPEVQQELKKENGVYHCYEDGKLVKKAWRVIDGKKYYFKTNGAAATLSYKIGGKYYVFNTNGQLFQPSGKKVVTVGNVKYQVGANGLAVKGWSADKKYYFDETGKRLTGIRVIKEKFYAFSSAGKYDKTKTKKLQKAAKYEKDITALQKLIGKPQKKKYYASCYGNGKDGIWTYKNFKVYTFRAKNGKEIFMGVE